METPSKPLGGYGDAGALFTDNDALAATMRQIARNAGLGEATIYNYFPTKEALVYAYYEDHMLACIDELKTVPQFETFSLQEQLQTFLDASLNRYLNDRTFVQETFRMALLGASRDWAHIRPIRSAFPCRSEALPIRRRSSAKASAR